MTSKKLQEDITNKILECVDYHPNDESIKEKSERQLLYLFNLSNYIDDIIKNYDSRDIEEQFYSIAQMVLSAIAVSTKYISYSSLDYKDKIEHYFVYLNNYIGRNNSFSQNVSPLHFLFIIKDRLKIALSNITFSIPDNNAVINSRLSEIFCYSIFFLSEYKQ